MKIINYLYLSGEAEVEKTIVCESEEAFEASLEIAKAEAIDGEYTVEDDGQPEPGTASTDDVLDALLGVTD